ncbi:MAG: cupin domain-containing protein [Opitutaceae bacterium]|jgi:quercetin dioxygenase-like cupin family protein|nr:cupin domain-containing protein [Opitutaceae bacterium]
MTAMKYLSLSLVCLLAVPSFAGDKPPVEVQKLAQSEKMWDGTPLPAYPSGQPEITVIKITIPPRSTLAWHKHPSINAGYLLAGTLTVISEDGRQLALKPGDALIELVDKYHCGRNDGDAPAEIVVFYAGKPGVPLSVAR